MEILCSILSPGDDFRNLKYLLNDVYIKKQCEDYPAHRAQVIYKAQEISRTRQINNIASLINAKLLEYDATYPDQ